MEPENRAFHNCTVWQFAGPLNVEALTRSLAEIVHRHAVLRTRIVIENGEPVQHFDPITPFHLPRIDLRRQNGANNDTGTQVQALIQALSQRPYDFATEHAWRFQLVQVADEEHLLIVAKHHIASDGWSNGIFQRELSLLYTAFVRQQASPLPLLPIQYADYAAWQRSQLQGAKLERQLAYWRQQLQNPPVLQLPTDYPRETGTSNAGATHEFILPAALTTRLKALSKAHNSTLFMTLLSTFKILLFRYTGQQDLNVGTPIAGRSRAEVEELIGFFLNTLVLRSQLAPTDSFSDLLAQVRQTTLDAYTHQDIPVEKLIEELQPERITGATPLFQVLFLLQNMPRHNLELPGLRVERLPHVAEAVAYDLSCALHEDGGQLVGRLTYRRDLFLPATIARFADHYKTLLESAVADPTRAIATLPMLTSAERQQLLVTWNQTQFKHPMEKSIIDLFAAQVAERQEWPAFLVDGVTRTYGELDRRSMQLAHILQEADITPGTVVGVCLPRSFEAVIALLAIFKVGGVYLPLDPTYPRERLAFMLADTQAPIVVTNTELQPLLSVGMPPDDMIFKDRVPETMVDLICLDTLDLDISDASCHPVTLAQSHPDDPAYIIYTSGSTGRPKGVIVPHRQILNRLWWMWRKYPFAADEMSCQKTALNFVDSLWELLGPLLQGSPTVIIPDDVVRDPQRLVQSLARHGVTRLWLVPTLLRTILQSVPEIGLMLPKLRFLVASGEALPTELLHQTKAKLPHATLYNLFGTSEVWDATWYDPTEEQMPDDNTVPIGKPIENVQAYILDQFYQPVPIGVTGELYIGGIGLANGYLNQPELTASRFVTLEFGLHAHDVAGNAASQIANHRLYRTGDLARFRADGHIEFLGRIDFQVKIRGFRIELGEIEVALKQHPAVRDAVVVAHKGENDDQQLAAYLIATTDEQLATSQLRHFLQNQLPVYMLPATYTWLDAFPLTPSGKINHQALPAPALKRDTAADMFRAAQDALEMQLVQIWEKTLRVHPVGIHDNFFEIGGHSLLAVTLFERITKMTGKSLPLSVLLQAPTIAQQAVLLRQKNWQPRWSSLVAVRAGGSRPPLFLVPPARGTALSFTKLARLLDHDQPIYAFDPVGLNGAEEPLTSLEAMAAHYVAQIRLLQPEGPYRLGGMCVGGHIAFEMACQLHHQDEKVELLVLMDPSSPWNGPTWSASPRPVKTPFYLGRRLAHHFYYGNLGRILWTKAKRITYRFNKRFTLLEKVWQVQVQAQRRYRAHPYAGSIVLIQSAQNAHRPEYRARWSALALGGLDYHLVPGTSHRSLIVTNPAHVAQLAAHIEEHLHQLDATSRGTAD